METHQAAQPYKISDLETRDYTMLISLCGSFLCTFHIKLELDYEPCLEKTCFLHRRKQICRSAPLFSLHRMIPLPPKFQASSHLWQHRSLVCVRPRRKPRRQVVLRGSSTGILRDKQIRELYFQNLVIFY